MIIDKDFYVLKRKVDYGIVWGKKVAKIVECFVLCQYIPFKKDMNQKKNGLSENYKRKEKGRVKN